MQCIACFKMAAQKYWKCELLKHDQPCNYETDRPENLRRHIDEVHHGLKKTCHKCGKAMNQTSLIRHKKKDCQSTKQTKPNKSQPSCSIEPSIPEPLEIASISEYTVETKVQIATLIDGKTVVIPSKTQLKIGTCDFVLMTSSEIDNSVAPRETDSSLINNDVFLNDVLTPANSPVEGFTHIKLSITTYI